MLLIIKNRRVKTLFTLRNFILYSNHIYKKLIETFPPLLFKLVSKRLRSFQGNACWETIRKIKDTIPQELSTGLSQHSQGQREEGEMKLEIN